MKPNVVLALSNIGVALIIILISIPLIKRKIKMNHFYGIRIEKSFVSEDNWYEINAYAGKQLVIFSIPMILAGIVCLFIPSVTQNKTLIQVIMGAGPIIVCTIMALVRIFMYSSKL